ncbi:MAG: glutamate formimidoyltransferase [Planctomycetota bacterium]|jgi:glutamate formiminotransferase/formiminotetrahydrofolate cyclodeaminase
MQKLIECVPNFSEGRDPAVIRQITAAIETVEGVTLLDVDPGKATHRTVVTFAGEPGPVIEAAVRAARKAKELIDMQKHRGEHPRFGAVDVCPLVPISGVTLEECADYARRLGQRLGDELGITVFLYESAASRPERRNLATVRAGEYEGLADKLARPEWQPDFGPATFDPRYGATAVGARDFLIAYNVNLNTTSTRRANAIAFDVREKGRPQREGDGLTGPVVRDASGQEVWIPGTLKAVKAIGWFIEEYGIAQISMNLTDIRTTPLHVAFDEVCAKAQERGIRVTGSEIVGLVPLRAMLDAGRYFLQKQQRSAGIADREIIKIAVKSMGLDDLAPFDADKKIIEYVLAAKQGAPRLVDRSVMGFVEETASESPAPGGGSVAALLGALGAALAAMVANLSAHRRGWDDRWQEFSTHAERAKVCQDELIHLVDADTAAFDRVMAAFGLPKGTESEQQARRAAIEDATRAAAEVPLRTMEVALQALDVARAMAEQGMEASVSDAGVAALCIRSAVLGAGLNVRINAAQLKDVEVAAALVARADGFEAAVSAAEAEILAQVRRRIV